MRTFGITSICLLLLAAFTLEARAQDYGVGDMVVVPQAPEGIVIDGVIETDLWDLGANIDLLGATSWWADSFPQDIEDAYAQVLFAEDTLYVHVFIDDNELYTNTEQLWVSDQIFIGIDPVHEAGATDQLVDQDDWAGWPGNAPGDGPYAYKIFIGEDGGAVTLNFDEGAAAELARAVVYTDEEENDWGIEAAFYVPTVERGALIGFNVGGAQANAAACESEDTFGECAYGYFSAWSTENPGGDIYSRTDSYATLQMGVGSGEGYGSGVVVQVPRVEAGAITIDGDADEAAWDTAQMDIDAVQYWNPYGPIGEETPDPDLVTTTRLLWSEDTLYVHHLVQDIEIFWGGDTGSFWNSDMILVGVDNSFAGDSLFDADFGGGFFNAPTGPYTYFINGPAGVTFAWDEEIAPADSGWINAEVFVDDAALEWGLEAAIYVPNAAMDAMIGFDIGGAQASEAQCVEGFCDYAYFSWQSGANGVDPGTINRDASQWAALMLVDQLTTAVEEHPAGVAQDFTLRQNYPNPFLGRTQIEYAVPRAGHVTIDVYDVLGRQVATLVDAPRAASRYDVSWTSEGLPGGLYFYRLRVDGEPIATRMMTVLK